MDGDTRVVHRERDGETVLEVSFDPTVLRATPSLTAAESAVSAQVATGLSNAEIAAARGVSERTVVKQVAAAMRKLRCDSRRQLAFVLNRG